LAGSRKFSVDLVSRDDLACLTREAAEISGIPYVMDVDKDLAIEILDKTNGKEPITAKTRIKKASS